MKEKPTKVSHTRPSVELLEAELAREKYRSRYRTVLRSTAFTLVVVAAIAVLVAMLWLPFLQIYGASMAPTLQDGEILCCVKTNDFSRGDIVAFYYNNKVLVKRVIALPGDTVDLDEDGFVFVNDERIDEPYLADRALGECDIDLPYTVPESRLFVMGDHRSTSVDSRTTVVGCIADEQLVGRVWLRLWPLNRFGNPNKT